MTESAKPTPRVAIVHEWLTGMRGGEKCVEALCEMFPDAKLFTLVHVKGTVSPTIERMPIRTSFIHNLPFAAKHYRNYLPLFPLAIERLDLREFDIVISSNHAVAKGVRTGSQTLHICYCHTPMRYIWNLYDQYFGKEHSGLLTRLGMKMFVRFLRQWDVRTANNPHYFIANSRNVQARIKQTYGREAVVIYPPVDTALFQPTTHVGQSRGVNFPEDEKDYFLIVSAFVPYKRIDLAIETFNRTGDRLVIIGSGPEEARLKRISKPNIEFLGWQPDEVLKTYYAGCKAVIFPGEEDFGIVPIEAMASGKPVIAFAKGGALETVIETEELRTGVLFHEQTSNALKNAMSKCNATVFNPSKLRAHAKLFDREVYKEKMREFIESKWSAFQKKRS